MNGALALGVQTPRIVSIPPYVSSAGQEAIDLCSQIGLHFDPWQQFCLHHGLGEREDGRWAAFEAGIVVSRQNGKDSIFEGRELAGLFVFNEQLILHSAHEFKTAQEHFRRVLFWLENTDWLRRRVKSVRTSHGEEGVELLTGQRLRFVARSTGSGRGFSGDCVILNEAFNLPETSVDALMPTMSARPNPQLWYGSSPGDKTIAPCEQLARVRRRGIAGDDPSLFYAEWSIDPHTDQCARDEHGAITCADHDDPDDPASWAKANPALGIRISEEHVARERASMGAKGFARERLGVGNWPADVESHWEVIPEARWLALADEDSEPEGRVAFALTVSPDRQWAAIGVAGRRADGLTHAEVVEHRPGTKWVTERVVELVQQWEPCAFVVDAGSPAGSLIADLEAAGVEVVKPTTREVAHSFGQFLDAVIPEQGAPALRYLPDVALDAAVAGAATRKLTDAKAWDAQAASVDITPLTAITSAMWGFATRGHIEEESGPEPFVFIS